MNVEVVHVSTVEHVMIISTDIVALVNQVTWEPDVKQVILNVPFKICKHILLQQLLLDIAQNINNGYFNGYALVVCNCLLGIT